MVTAEGTCKFWLFFFFFFIKEGVGLCEKEEEGGLCICVCVYTQHAKIPQPDGSYPGTCDTRLRRKFHILPYHRTSISSLVLDGFQNSYNCRCYKWAEREHVKVETSWCFFPLLLSTCLTPRSLRCFSLTHPQTMPPCAPGFGEGDLAVTGWQTSLSRRCVWAKGVSSCSVWLRSYVRSPTLTCGCNCKQLLIHFFF